MELEAQGIDPRDLVHFPQQDSNGMPSLRNREDVVV